MLAQMLGTMCDRGPDSAGFAVYGTPRSGLAKVTVQSPAPDEAFSGLAASVGGAVGTEVAIERRGSHAVLTVPADRLEAVRDHIRDQHGTVRVLGAGDAIEIYKEVGYPTEVAAVFGLANMAGTHAIGHTRMATESAVTTLGAHPFSTGPDQCLVHNGSLSNHNNLRRTLARDGIRFETENDSEVAAAYLTAQMGQGSSLGEALEKGLDDLDGFFTFVVGTKNGFGVLRDPIACKPAVLAETDRFVAFGSEYRALAALPGIETAKVWEPEPATVYFWER
ncbi:glutamine amidotransferase [Chelatococcus reniformis]|uniref:Glutamine amidotransferase n=2 Tax=Chelatococcus reniformis TaxID=1494448 RepID=A0A916XNB2_9HYPH|nr:glutamine amidotransferase [Chelatococcus reniformis]